MQQPLLLSAYVLARSTCTQAGGGYCTAAHLALAELAGLQRAAQDGRHLVVGHLLGAAGALLPEQPHLLHARVLGAQEGQHRQALPGDVPQQELAHSGDAAEQRVHVRGH
jgi:hypothetical protein